MRQVVCTIKIKSFVLFFKLPRNDKGNEGRNNNFLYFLKNFLVGKVKTNTATISKNR